MKAIELNMPDEVYKKLENLASQDHHPVNAFASRKLEEFAHAVSNPHPAITQREMFVAKSRSVLPHIFRIAPCDGYLSRLFGRNGPEVPRLAQITLGTS